MSRNLKIFYFFHSKNNSDCTVFPKTNKELMSLYGRKSNRFTDFAFLLEDIINNCQIQLFVRWMFNLEMTNSLNPFVKLLSFNHTASCTTREKRFQVYNISVV